jgi:hypothetical protein
MRRRIDLLPWIGVSCLSVRSRRGAPDQSKETAVFVLKPDFEDVLERYEAWWDCEIIDRPLVSITYPSPDRHPLPASHHSTHCERWFDTDYVVARRVCELRNTVFAADSLPIAYPNLGPEIFSAFYGCEMIYGDRTGWTEPCLSDWSPESLERLQLDEGGSYYRKLLELTDAFLDAGRGQFIVGYTDLHGGGDAIAAFRDPQALLIDTLERPDEIKALCDRITTDFLHVYDFYHEKLTAAGMPSTTWCAATSKGKFHVPSNDLSCMISDAAFEDLFIPGIIRECSHMDRCIYHLDGPQALRFLDRLLEIPEIDAIQWVYGAGNGSWQDWVEVYEQIQAKGKAMQILGVEAQDLHHLFETFDPKGVWISSVSGISNKEEADAALAEIERWTRKR